MSMKDYVIHHNKECAFCGSKGLSKTDEHYYVCLSCGTLYTFMILHSQACEHISEYTPCLICAGRALKWKDGVVYIAEYQTYDGNFQQSCSRCGGHCVADGW